MDRDASQSILFAGRRSPALQAARAGGFEVLLVNETPSLRSERDILGFRQTSFDESTDWEKLVADLCRGRSVSAVVAGKERGVVAAARMREALGIPGTGVEAAQRATDKIVMKRAVRKLGVPTADFVGPDEGMDRRALIDRLGLPMILKDRRGSGGRNQLVVQLPGEVPERLAPHRMAERVVRGTEMSVESLVLDGEVIWTNFTEYLKPLWANLLPADLSPQDAKAVLTLNRAAIQATGIRRGMTHLELFLTPYGPIFGELAARPPGGHIMTLLQLAGEWDPWSAWLTVERGEHPGPLPRPARYAGMWMLHPGMGVVREVRGFGSAARIQGVTEAVSPLRRGSVVASRDRSGQEGGHVTAVGETRKDVVESLRQALDLMSIQMEPREG